MAWASPASVVRLTANIKDFTSLDPIGPSAVPYTELSQTHSVAVHGRRGTAGLKG